MSDSYTVENPENAEEALPVPAEPSVDEQDHYEGTPEELTGFKSGGPAVFDRKKVMMVLCCVFSAVVLLGIIFSTSRSSKRKQGDDAQGIAANAPTDFLQRELRRSLLEQEKTEEEKPFSEESPVSQVVSRELPEAVPVSFRDPPPIAVTAPREDNLEMTGQPPPVFVAHFSPMVPMVEGSLFAGRNPSLQGAEQTNPYVTAQQAAAEYLQRTASMMPSVPGVQDPYQIQNNQANKQSFYNAASGGVASGGYLPADIIWTGTIIPAVLETAINTDLPGNVIARVTQNIYDSRTGKKLLIPQGSLLIAQYNSSISYAQRRIQIVWDVLIRPDGYQIELEGMNGVDKRGMSGLRAAYRENFFEYVKAAGIIAMFSMAQAKMTEQAAQVSSGETAQALAASNTQFVNQIAGNFIGRAMDIQPTLTVNSGQTITILVNKNIFLPPVNDYPVTQKYTLK